MLDLDTLAADLARRADPDKKAWWERYLKGAIAFHGVPMAGIRESVHSWACDAEAADLRNAAFALLERPIAEEKLAGILVLQELLAPTGHLEPSRDLPRIAAAFDAGHIADWSTTDWLCVRVIGPMIERGGAPAGRAVAAWTGAPSLWRRRAATVGFVPVASRGDAAFRGLVDLVLAACERNAADQERFVQTGIGWVLRDLSEAAPERVFGFLEAHRERLTREAMRMAAARLADEQRTALGITGKRRRR